MRTQDAPARPQQHLAALARANKIRLARAALKREVAAGKRTACEVLRAAPLEVQSMRISELLMSQRRWGRARTRRVLLPLSLPENKAIGTMTERQRKALADLLEGKRAAPTTRAQRSRSGPPVREVRLGVTREGASVHVRRPERPDLSLCGVELLGDAPTGGRKSCRSCGHRLALRNG